MIYKIGKIKTQRSSLIQGDEIVDSPIISSIELDLEKYDDITSIENWFKYGGSLTTDYLQLRERVRAILNSVTWNGTTPSEKSVIIELYLKETSKTENQANMEKVMYLMGLGFSLDDAQTEIIKSYANYHLLEIDSCYKRANSERIFKIIAKYLNLADAADLIKTTHKLFDLYKTQGVRGTKDGESGEGLFDFLESTVGTSFETTGLRQQGYALKSGDYNIFINELMDVLRHGNY
jgi:hypothetical protein